MNNDRYSGTILSGTYTPIVFSSSICLSGSKQSFSPARVTEDKDIFLAAEVISVIWEAVALPRFFEAIFKTKEL